MTHVQPCALPENNPDDWYLRPDGKQYSDESLAPADLLDLVQEAAQARRIRPDEAEAIIEDAERDLARDAIVRRRHAKDKCHTECYFRLQCLDLALRNDETFGTWGGYYQEELADIRKVRRERGRKGRLLN
jgi:hypothetical protein